MSRLWRLSGCRLSLKRWAARRDGTEVAIVDALRRVGAAVLHLSDPGAPDLLVLYRGRLTLLEIKAATGRATLAQERRLAEGWPVVTVRTWQEAYKTLGVETR